MFCEKVISGCIVCFLAGAVIGIKAERDIIRRDALEAGAGKYVQVEEGSPRTEWRWVTELEKMDE